MRLGSYVDRVRARRLASERSRARRQPETAFVLTGGGVLGAVQAGQVQALTEAGITPDVVVGTSVGSLNATYVASQIEPSSEILANIWRDLRTEDIFPGSRFQRAWHMIAKGDHIYPNDGIRKLIEKLPIASFEECAVPLHISATNLRTGVEHWFTSGSLMPAILASTALPAIFPPVLLDGETYVDGGVVNNAPISRAVELGAKRIYLLQCGSAKREAGVIRRPIDVLVAAFAHARATRLNVDLAHYGSDVEVHVLPTANTSGIRYNDLSHTNRLITSAREATTAFLQERAAAAQA